MSSPFSRRSFIQVAASATVATWVRPSSAAILTSAQTPGLTGEEIASIDAALGKKGSYNATQGTHVVPFPRNDLHVKVRGASVPTGLGFGGWAAFKRTADGKSGVFMSDNVLLEDEVNPLIDAAIASGLEVGAIHNHFFYEDPRVFFMHLHGMGEPADLAARYAKAISTTKIAPANQPVPNPPSKTAKDIFDTSSLDKIVGKTGVVNGAAFKYTVGRSDLKITEMGAEMTAAIGLNTWCTFVGEPGAATVAGDVAMLAHEVNPVIRKLRAAGFEVCAVHSHMLTEQPRILFLHYLGHGKAEELAATFRAIIDMLGTIPAGMKMEML